MRLAAALLLLPLLATVPSPSASITDVCGWDLECWCVVLGWDWCSGSKGGAVYVAPAEDEWGVCEVEDDGEPPTCPVA